MSWKHRLRRVLRDWLIAALGLVAIAWAMALYLQQPPARPTRLAITAGSARGLRQQMALTLASEARVQGIFIEPKATAGSEEALDQVDSRALDLALVQGGLELGRRKNVRQVAALYIEPLHLLVKEEIHADVSHHLAALRNRVVNLSEPRSGTYALASEVLRFVGLQPGSAGRPGDCKVSTLSYERLMDETDRDKLPEAVFTVSLLPSALVKHLVTKHRYQLVALPFASAFSLNAMAGDFDSTVALEARDAIERNRVYDAEIPAFTYGVEPPAPGAPIHTLGTRLLLVAHKDADPQLISRILDVAFTSQFAHLTLPPLEPKLLDLPPEFPLHEGTRVYLARNMPLIAENAIDVLEKEVSILGAILGGSFFLWQWLRQRYRRRRDLGFEHYVLRVMEVEGRAQDLESSAVLDLGELLRLQQDLGRLKTEALKRFADGELGGEELFSGFLAHVSDTRNYLTRLILHVRENLERAAKAQGRSPDALWQESLGVSESVAPLPASVAQSGVAYAPHDDQSSRGGASIRGAATVGEKGT